MKTLFKTRFMALLLVAIMMLTVAPVTVSAEEIKGTLDYGKATISYTIDTVSGTATITDYSYSGFGPDCVTPTEIDGYPVVAIGDYAFAGGGVYSPKNVVISEGVTSIGERAFQSSFVRSLTLPSTLTHIGAYAFNDCSAINQIMLSEKITHIEAGTFGGCTSLKEIELPEGLLSIGNNAFSSSGLEKIVIPKKVSYIGNRAFALCSDLSSIEVDADNPYYHVNNNCLIETESKMLMRGCQDSVIPADGSVTSIGEYAFSGTNLSEITISECIENMGVNAFYKCGRLENISVPKSIGAVPDYAFAECTALVSVVIEDGIESIGNRAFENCNKLIDVSIADSVSTIGDYAFSKCSSIEILDLPENLTGMYSYVLSMCKNLTTLYIDNNIKGILPGAISGCDSLKTVYFDGTEEEWKKINFINLGHPGWDNVEIVFKAAPVQGDIDGDGIVNSIDVNYLKKAISGNASLTDEQKAIADLNGDGEVNSIDTNRMKRYIAGNN